MRIYKTIAFLALLVACSSGTRGYTDAPDGSLDQSSPGFGDVLDGGGQTCNVLCSSDLHDVVDANGNVITQCADDEGCSPCGGCVPACASATANQSSIGCEYYSVPPPATFDPDSTTAGYCFAMFVANTWSSPVTLTADWNGQPLSTGTFAYVPSGSGPTLTYEPLPSGQLPAGGIAILFLNSYVPSDIGPYGPEVYGCPPGLNVAVTSQAVSADVTGVGQAFHVTADRPVVAYDIYPYGGGRSKVTSATLLAPTSTWDTNYIVVTFEDGTVVGQTSIGHGVAQITALTDNTTVTISPTTDVVDGTGVVVAPQGVLHTFSLSQGEFVELRAAAGAFGTTLTGTTIQSNNPIGVWGASHCPYVGEVCCCDSMHQQLFPVHALGHEYAAVRYRNRYDTGPDESTPWRLVGAVNGTVLTYDPAPPAGAPVTLSSGQSVDFWSSTPFVVSSQDAEHPFYAGAYMTSATYLPTGSANGRGDAEWVNIVPPDQFMSSYVFFTDPTYPETDLVVIRKTTTAGFADVNLDCAGVLTGWQPVGASGEYQFTRIDLSRHDFQAQGSCDNGRHEIQSASPFGVTVWGWGTEETLELTDAGTLGSGSIETQFVSYAYPAGANVKPINTVVVPPAPN
jgi:hypothetical protein